MSPYRGAGTVDASVTPRAHAVETAAGARTMTKHGNRMALALDAVARAAAQGESSIVVRATAYEHHAARYNLNDAAFVAELRERGFRVLGYRSVPGCFPRIEVAW